MALWVHSVDGEHDTLVYASTLCYDILLSDEYNQSYLKKCPLPSFIMAMNCVSVLKSIKVHLSIIKVHLTIIKVRLSIIKVHIHHKSASTHHKTASTHHKSASTHHKSASTHHKSAYPS